MSIPLPLDQVWKTAREWADLALPGLPKTERGLQLVAQRESWPSRPRQGRGGGLEYPLSALPPATVQEFSRRRLGQRTGVVTAAPGHERFARLASATRDVAMARLTMLRAVERIVAESGFAVTPTRAIETVLAALADGTADHELARAARRANARRGHSRLVSRATLCGWWKAWAASANDVAVLAPAEPAPAPVPAWAKDFLDYHLIPSGPSVTETIERMAADGLRAPSPSAARRLLERMDAISRNAGRLGPRELKKLKVFKKRDASKMNAAEAYIGDGHTFKAEVAHPRHGRPFRPEITSFLDVATRRWVGWSADLAENTWAVADAFKDSCRFAGVPSILYYDNGSGAKNRVWDDQVAGLAASLNIEKLHSAPWSSQARGVIEVFNKNVLHKLARRLVTYVGPRMDREARQSVFKITRRQIAEVGVSRLLPSWDQLRDALEAEREAYNARPHRGLPKILDAAIGRYRHMSPDEAWAKSVAEMPAETIQRLTREQADALFMPRVERTTARGLVRWFGREYFAAELEAFGEDRVLVGYDLRDPTYVLVSTLDGRPIAVARESGHRSDYFPGSVIELAKQKRAQGRLKRLEAHAEEARAELAPQLALSATAAPSGGAAEVLPAVDAVPGAVDRPGDGGEQPIFDDDAVWVTAILAGRVTLDDEQFDYLRGLARQKSWREVRRMAGVDLAALDAFIERTKQQRNAAS